MRSGDSKYRRFGQVANLLALPDPNSPSIRTGDVEYVEAENLLARCVGVVGARFWFIMGPGTGTAEPLFQIVTGSGAGLTSSPHFKFDPTTGTVVLQDTAGAPLMNIDGAAAARLFELKNAAGFDAFTAILRAAAQSVSFNDSAGVTMELIDERAAVRTITTQDQNGLPINVAVLTAAGRTDSTLNPAGFAVIAVDTKAASQSVTFKDVGGVPLAVVDELPANRTINLYNPAGFLAVHMQANATDNQLAQNDSAGNAFFISRTTSTGLRFFNLIDELLHGIVGVIGASTVRRFQVTSTNSHSIILVDALDANRRVIIENDAGAVMLQVDTLAANEKIIATVPIDIGKFTLAAANAPADSAPPCAVLCPDCIGNQQKIALYREMGPPIEIGRFLLFLRK